MQINLKTARRIDSVLEECIRRESYAVGYNDRDTIHPSLSLALASAEEHYNKAVAKLMNLVEVRAILRKAVGKANETHGINSLVSDIAANEAKIVVLKGLGSTSVTYSTTIGKESVTRNTSFSKDMSNEITALKFQNATLRDRATGINAQATIEVSDDIVAVLKQLGIPL